MALGKSPSEIIASGDYPLLSIAPHWTRVLLSEVATVQNGFAFDSKYFNHNSGMPLIRIRDIQRDKTENFYSGSYDEDFVVRKGDLLIGMDGDFRAAFWQGTDGLLNQRVCRLVQKTERYSRKFLFIVLQPYLNAINAETSSVTVKHLSSRTISDIPLPLPPLDEQHRIVAKIEELFSELDAGEENLRLARKQLGVYRQSLLKRAFEGKLTEGWRKRNKGKLETVNELLKRIPAPSQPKGGRQASAQVIEGVAGLSVNRPSKPTPSGWLWTPLLRIARQETGHTPSRNRPEYWGGKFDWLGITDARKHHGGVIPGTTQKITRAGLENSSARTLPAQTVCLSRTASVGYVCIMGKGMATSQDFVTWTCTEALAPKFLMYALLAEGDEIRRFGKGTTHTTIYFPEIRALHIALPSAAEQQEIVRLLTEKLEAIERNKCEIDAALLRSSTLRQSILTQAFIGNLVPRDPANESAVELLNRILAERKERSADPKMRKSVIKKNTGEYMTEKPISIVDAMEKSKTPLSGQDLLAASGYPNNSNIEQLEQFFIDLRNAISEKKIYKCRRDSQQQDWFDLTSRKARK